MFGRRSQSKRAETAILREELTAQREVAQGLVERYELQVRNVRTAVKAVGQAREERDEYRRVLAAQIATDRRREARVEALEGERLRLEATAMREGQAASEEGGRRRELSERLERLEARLTDELAARERAVGDAADRSWAEREASREELVRLIASHRGEVTAALAETRSELAALRRAHESPRPQASTHSVRRIRTGTILGLGLLSTLAALALIPPTVLAVSDPERALFVHLASGLGPWHLIAAVAFFCTAAVGLLTWGLREVEGGPTAPVSNAREPRAVNPSTSELREVELTPVSAPPARAKASATLIR